MLILNTTIFDVITISIFFTSICHRNLMSRAIDPYSYKLNETFIQKGLQFNVQRCWLISSIILEWCGCFIIATLFIILNLRYLSQKILQKQLYFYIPMCTTNTLIQFMHDFRTWVNFVFK